MTASSDDIVEQIPRLRRFAAALTRDRSRADDLVQDTLVQAISKAHQFRDGTNLIAWLLTIMRNLHRSQLRRSASRPELKVIDGSTRSASVPPSQADNLELRELNVALGFLPDEQRMTILLIGLEGFSYEEAAETTGVPVGTVRSRLSRARETLRQRLERAGGARVAETTDQAEEQVRVASE